MTDGVSNGSLFTYFETKADLFNQLYLELETGMATTSLEGLAVQAPLREQFSSMWSNWTRWATSNPDKRRALALLDLSGDIALQTRAASHQAMAGVAEMPEQARARGPMRDAPMELVVAIMNSQAETTMDFMIKDPANAGAHSGVHHHRPTSGIGHRTALELAKHGRSSRRAATRESSGRRERGSGARAGMRFLSRATCRISRAYDSAAAQISALPLPLAGLVNNAGIFGMRATKNTQGRDTTFATSHLGPFALTEALMPHLPDEANVVFVWTGAQSIHDDGGLTVC